MTIMGLMFSPAGTAFPCLPSWTCMSVPNWERGRWLPVTWLSGLKRSCRMSSRWIHKKTLYKNAVQYSFTKTTSQCLFSSRKCLCCQTWTTSTSPWCTLRWTVLKHRSIYPLSPNGPKARPPSPSRESHQRSLGQSLTSASLLILQNVFCTMGTQIGKGGEH